MWSRMLLVAVVLGMLGCSGTDNKQSELNGKPNGKGDAVTRLCQDSGLAADCDICVVRNWYGDGVCDDFCKNPDPDCVGEGQCTWDIASPLGDTTGGLEEKVKASVSFDATTIGNASELQKSQIRQAALHLGLSNGDDAFEKLFDISDDGDFSLSSVEVDGKSYDWVQWYSGDTEVGVFYNSGTLELVTEVSDGDLKFCKPAEVKTCSSDAECGDQQYCLSGKCETLGACTVADECYGQPLITPACIGSFSCNSGQCNWKCGGIKCQVGDKVYGPGDSFPSDDGCNSCSCSVTGTISCTEKACVKTCQSNGDCGEGKFCASGECKTLGYCETADQCYDQPLITPACMGSFSCKNNHCSYSCGGIKCQVGDKTYNVGDSFPADDGCNTCSCTPGGTVSCTEKACN